jgi:hypothetical protein
MSNGFPNRPSRSSFGPTLENAKPVRDPVRNPDADNFNLAFFQIAGCGLVVPRAWAFIDGAAGALLKNAEAWNANNANPAPLFAKSATGVYTLTYLSTYPDDAGQTKVLAPFAPAGMAVNRSTVRDVAVSLSGTTLTINLKEFSAGVYAAVDGQVLVWFM